MSMLLNSFWRAVIYCAHPRVVALSLLPILIMGGLSLTLGYFFWDDALLAVRSELQSSDMVNAMIFWLQGIGMKNLHQFVAAMLLLFLVVPLMVIVTLLVVAWSMTPSIVTLVATRRFAKLERKKGVSKMDGILWALGSSGLAGVALLVSLPLWLVPPLILLLPPLIWGWLTFRVMAYDALAGHATREEMAQVFTQYQGPLVAIGMISGYLLAVVPSLLWAFSAMYVGMAPILVPATICSYILMFAFASLWFAHYGLAALEIVRKKNATPPPTPPPMVQTMQLQGTFQVTPPVPAVLLTGPAAALGPMPKPAPAAAPPAPAKTT